jgi:hypothetical protein
MLQSPSDVTAPAVWTKDYFLPFETSVMVRVTTGGDMPIGIPNRKITVSIASSAAAQFISAFNPPRLSPTRSLGKAVNGLQFGTTATFTTNTEGLLTLFIHWDTSIAASSGKAVPQCTNAPCCAVRVSLVLIF